MVQEAFAGLNTIRRRVHTASVRSISYVKCSLKKATVCSMGTVTETDSVLIPDECFYRAFQFIVAGLQQKVLGQLPLVRNGTIHF
jgi:hypothetical protein